MYHVLYMHDIKCVYIYIYIYTTSSVIPYRMCCSYHAMTYHDTLQLLPVSAKKHSSGKEDPWKDKPSECQIRGWRAVSASGLQGKGSPERSVCSQTPVSLY